MKKTILTALIAIFFSTCGQQSKVDKNFERDFAKALDSKLGEEQLNQMLDAYSSLLTPGSDVTQLSQGLRGGDVSVYPLYEFKSEKIYTDNIDNLLNSKNKNQRILAYLVIASSGDISKENILLEKISTETGAGSLTWAGMALLHLNTMHTTALFDFLIKNEDFGDAHMIPMFFQLNKDSLRQTAYNRIGRTNEKTRILAAQLLSVTGSNPKTEMLLKQAVREWNIDIKGYAIYSISQLQLGNLLESFKPLLDSSQTRRIALKALANSPTDEDTNYLRELVNEQVQVSEELLDCFYESKNVDNIRYWLKLLYTKRMPGKYVFFIYKQPLITSDEILPDLQNALRQIKDPEILHELVRALEDRKDDKSLNLMISFLKSEDKRVRYWTAKTLENNTSQKLQTTEVKQLLANGLLDGN